MTNRENNPPLGGRSTEPAGISCFLFLALAALTQLTGCSRYEFNIIEPADLKQHVGHDREVIVPDGQLEYHFMAVEDRLVVRIFNSGTEPVKFVNDQSSLVDPEGLSHWLHPLTILPGSHMKLILPPEPHLVASTPRVGFGIGYGYVGPGWSDGFGYDQAIWSEPTYIATYDNGEPSWNWPAGGRIRVLLTFQKGTDKPFSQAWLIDKQKI